MPKGDFHPSDQTRFQRTARRSGEGVKNSKTQILDDAFSATYKPKMAEILNFSHLLETGATFPTERSEAPMHFPCSRVELRVAHENA